MKFHLLLQMIALACLTFTSGMTHAEITLDKSLTQSSVLKKMQVMQKEVIWPYAESQTFVFDRDTTRPYRTNLAAGANEGSVYPWEINRQRYFSYVVAYVPDDDPIEGCKAYRRHDINWEGPDCIWINMRHLVCHLFMMTEQGQIAGIGRLQIARDSRLIKGKPFCYDVRAMSAPKEINDSMLITVSYIDSAAQADPRVSPDEFPMTVLLRFKQEADGKLDITQDEHCLPNPNRIASIRQARQVLKAKGCLK